MRNKRSLCLIEEMTPCVIQGFSLSLYSLVYFLTGLCVFARLLVDLTIKSNLSLTFASVTSLKFRVERGQKQ